MIELIGVSIRQGKFALNNISFRVSVGGYTVLMGRSGGGKTTILEAIAGLRPVGSGSIKLGGRDVTNLRPAERGLGYVPQDGVLFGTMSVCRNLAFALTVRGDSPKSIDARVGELAAWLGVEHLLNRFPRDLSGGEKQRVALGRALAAKPTVLLLDEPLSSLDDKARDDLVKLLTTIREQRSVAVLHVTHDRREAQQLADDHLRLEQGDITGRL